MKKKPGKYLEFYNTTIEHGKMKANGLCCVFGGDKLFRLIDPEDGECDTYWGYDQDETICDDWDWDKRYYQFTPLRQNVVLLMAAMNNEL